MSTASRLLIASVTSLAFAGTAVADDATPDDRTTPADDPAAANPAAVDPAAATDPTTPSKGPDRIDEPATPPADGAGTSPATDGIKPPALSGYVDTQYAFNVARPASNTNLLFPYSFQHNNISLNAAHLAINGEAGHGVAYTVELDGGTDAVTNTSNYAPPAAGNTYKVDVQEAYGTYKHESWGLKVGKFVTYQGIEVIESPSNPTISRGYLFSYAEPFTHTGAMFTLQASAKVDVHVGVVNGWDVMADNNKGKTLVLKVGIIPSATSFLTISATAGPEVASNWRESFDVSGQVKAGTVDVNFQGNFGTEAKAALTGGTATWFGAGVQPVMHLSDKFQLGARIELFIDSKGARTGGLGAMADPTNAEGKLTLINVAVSPGYQLSPHFMLRGEARMDIADQKLYINHAGDGSTKNQIVLLAQAVASF